MVNEIIFSIVNFTILLCIKLGIDTEETREKSV